MQASQHHLPARPILTAAEEAEELALLRAAYGFVSHHVPPPGVPANDPGLAHPGLAKARTRPRGVPKK